RYISEILDGIPNCFVYIDDIIVYSKTKKEHTETLIKVLKRLLAKTVKINFDKSNFFKNEIDVLGYKINNEGIFPNTRCLNNKIFDKKINSKRDVQKILGIINWYRKFIPNLSTRIAEISNLLKDDNKSKQITQKMRTTIHEIIDEICKGVKLAFPDYTKKFTLECDASDVGIGSVLKQEDKIIGYFSKKLKHSELNYSIVEKEYLAMLLSMIHFEKIIQGNYVEIYTDSANCTRDSKVKTTRINRWKILMNEFNYKIYHIKGKDNAVADQLSRCFSLKAKEDYTDYMEAINKSALKDTNGNYMLNKNRVIIQPNKYLSLMRTIHDLSGHKGISTMFNNLKNYIYIKNMIYVIKECVETCTICTRVKEQIYRNNRDNKIIAKRKLERISTDIYVQLK
ncbi:MAG: RNase H-like domain-containing protein, partial [Lactobacillaceae bacterium]